MLHHTFSPATEAALEALNVAHDAFLRDDSARNESRLFDAAISAGMDRDHADLHGWSAERIAAWLVSADCEENYCDCGATIDLDERTCGLCAAEYRAERYAMSEAL